MSKKFNLINALMRFRITYSELVNASKEMPDYDMTEGYPFYLLDFEEIDQNVSQWCSIHSAQLMKQLEDVVANPTCLDCKFFGTRPASNGMCVGITETACNKTMQTIVFNRDAVIPFVISQGITAREIEPLQDEELQYVYMLKVELYSKKK